MDNLEASKDPRRTETIRILHLETARNEIQIQQLKSLGDFEFALSLLEQETYIPLMQTIPEGLARVLHVETVAIYHGEQVITNEPRREGAEEVPFTWYTGDAMRHYTQENPSLLQTMAEGDVQQSESSMTVPMVATIGRKVVPLGAIAVGWDVKEDPGYTVNQEVFNRAARLIAGHIVNTITRQSADRFSDPRLIRMLARNPRILEDGITCEATILFSDIKGSTTQGERLRARDLRLLLNEYHKEVTSVLIHYRALVDKYLGDGVMGIFGAVPDEEHASDPSYAAAISVCAALEVQEAVRRHNEHKEELLKQGLATTPVLQLRVGIDTGEVDIGFVGCPTRHDISFVGDRVNSAKRIQELASPGEVVVTKAVIEACEKCGLLLEVTKLDPVKLKGRNGLSDLFIVKKRLPQSTFDYQSL
ncbi:hypothetical protein A2Z00_04785 [Candidatus Gottesmanbacteria bacterium RBG_13_45_10]|uniref:Guanylate cyclase domain-containing protein n=1 Tax=Candidatus Gottesmanbacteria bacterium RBG_13_45_10 TaxID=1798370 RepID=A0A1F5ZG06_9BACT|nr:MAG: hypothetical protein A2Z00_04785 [Candidatus Gottesmanbacteria bacterium RBG_13_45_10]